MDLVEFSVSGSTSVTAGEAFDRVVPRDDNTLFLRYLVVPGVVSISGATGPWNTPGRRRTVHLSDGSSFREEIVQFDRPGENGPVGAFRYRVTGYTKMLGRLVSDARADWFYEPAEGGSRIRWVYGFRPMPGRRFIVRWLIGPIWSSSMRRSMGRCVAVAEGRVTSTVVLTGARAPATLDLSRRFADEGYRGRGGRQRTDDHGSLPGRAHGLPRALGPIPATRLRRGRGRNRGPARCGDRGSDVRGDLLAGGGRR